ncbi:MAG TPA: threonine--tRNA ligase [Candidatus Absconditabacterales bacterium]|nr:threonine--tRNA ligase [Candidatus Absconditabacterales bacterium]HPK27698.1 threonine--tRNA ligase [Candidatus Absconditabacterales bacterium]
MGLDLLKKRHSLAHVLAQAVQREQQRNVEVGIGPAIDNGFYYDFLFDSKNQIKEEDLTKIQNQMEKIVKEGQEFIVLEMTDAQSKELVTKIMKQKYKEEMRAEFVQDGESITFYVNTIVAAAKDNLLKGIDENYIKYYQEITDYLQKKYPGKFENKFVTFLDMCEGPHVESTKEIDPKSFKLEKLAGAYWRGDENNVMMTRIYARAFDSKDKLREYSDMMEEAKKRDHRVLGKKFGLFAFSENVGLGLPLWLPKGAGLFRTIEDFRNEAHRKNGYEFVRTPHIGNKKLWEISGHWGFYSDSMYPPMEAGQTLEDQKAGKKVSEADSEQYLLKPMNCPFHVEIYKAEPKSYRHFPLRRCETGTVYRFEKKGQLSGLTRVRGFTQDDAHIMCRKDQVEDELQRVVRFILYIYESFGFKKEDVKVYLSLRDPQNTHKYAGNDEGWKLTQDVLKKVADDMQLDYTAEEGEAAFYGPKLDFKVKDCLGREWQCSTLQFDFNLPERFDMTYINNKGEEERPYMLHNALFGSFERFIGVLIEHYAGAFPFWLAPEQIRIIPVADKFENYAQKVKEELVSKGYRVTVDYSSDSFSKKIRNGEIEKIPYLFIVGEKEESKNTISRRSYKTKEQGTCTLEEFIKGL